MSSPGARQQADVSGHLRHRVGEGVNRCWAWHAMADRARHHGRLEKAGMQGRAMAWRATRLHGLEQAGVHRRALAWRATQQVVLRQACVYGRAMAWRANHVGELKWLVGQECLGALGHGRKRTCGWSVQGRQGIAWLWEQCFSS